MERRQLIVGLGAGAATLALGVAGAPARQTWARGGTDPYDALRSAGALALLRHAEAPGIGDPDGFKLDTCASQRNLDEKGRAQARRIGEALKAREIAFDRVLSSPWCRCLETARLVTGREPEIEPALSSFFERRSDAAGQLARLRAVIGALAPDARVLMVTHQVVISGLTGVSPASGEMVVLESRAGDGTLPMKGRIKAPA